MTLADCKRLYHADGADESSDQSSDSESTEGSSSFTDDDDEDSESEEETLPDLMPGDESDSTSPKKKKKDKAAQLEAADLLQEVSNKGLDTDPNVLVDKNKLLKPNKQMVQQSDGTLANVHDLFGPMFKPEVNTSMYWAVKKESKVYRYKELVSALKLPSLPNNITQLMGWMSAVLAILASFDISTSGVLSHWWAMLEHPTGHITEEWAKYHSNAQGLVLLDRVLGRLMATQHNFHHPIFGRQFRTYVLWSQARRDAPSGRAMVVSMGVRFRVHRQVGSCVTIWHLYQIELRSYDDNAVATFMDKVRHIFCQLTPGDLSVGGCGVDFTFQWLWNKIKNWKRIEHEVRKIRRVGIPHRRRTWQYLWTAMTSALAIKDEDRNENDLNATLGRHQSGWNEGGKVYAAQTKQQKRKDKR